MNELNGSLQGMVKHKKALIDENGKDNGGEDELGHKPILFSTPVNSTHMYTADHAMKKLI